MGEEDDSYAILLDKTVLRAARLGAPSFLEITLACKGAFPSDVWSAIKRLNLIEAVITSKSARRILDTHRMLEDWWPEPSPVNYEWRFTCETAEDIAQTALEYGRRILCLGTPTVFRNLVFRGADAYLVDRNPFIATSLQSVSKDRIVIADVSDRRRISALNRFDVVVMDPPWYPAHINYWLNIARELVASTGTILLTLFPELTRPSARSERTALLERLGDFGVYEFAPRKVSYETPLFERETLSALGVPPLPVWRTGELLALSVSSSSPAFDAAAPTEDEWGYFLFGTQVVGLRKSTSDAENITVSAPYEDFTFLLRSVSTRDPIRPIIGLWTSRNRVAKLTGSARIGQFLKTLQSGVACQIAIDQTAMDSQESAALKMLVALIGL